MVTENLLFSTDTCVLCCVFYTVNTLFYLHVFHVYACYFMHISPNLEVEINMIMCILIIRNLLIWTLGQYGSYDVLDLIELSKVSFLSIGLGLRCVWGT